MSADQMMVGVQATFSFGEMDAVHTFDSCERKRGSPYVKGAEKEGASSPTDDKYDHRYSGRHDHGPLPALKSGGPHEELVDALLEAKRDSDSFLTSVINHGNTYSTADGGRHGQGNGEDLDPAQGAAPDKTAGALMETGEEEGSGTSPEAPAQAQPAKRPKP